MAVLGDFLVESLASLVGAFAGVFLALVAERRARRHTQAGHERRLSEEYARAKQAILGSVVKNTAEASRIKGILAREPAATMLDARLEMVVWDATRDQFVQLCASVDERVRFASFFDEVQHLHRLVEFHRHLHTSVTTGGRSRQEPELAALLRDAAKRLQGLAEDVRLSGLMLVTDYGAPVHKRMLGIPAPAAPGP